MLAEYIAKAVERARYEKMDNGRFFATIPAEPSASGRGSPPNATAHVYSARGSHGSAGGAANGGAAGGGETRAAAVSSEADFAGAPQVSVRAPRLPGRSIATASTVTGPDNGGEAFAT